MSGQVIASDADEGVGLDTSVEQQITRQMFYRADRKVNPSATLEAEGARGRIRIDYVDPNGGVVTGWSQVTTFEKAMAHRDYLNSARGQSALRAQLQQHGAYIREIPQQWLGLPGWLQSPQAKNDDREKKLQALRERVPVPVTWENAQPIFIHRDVAPKNKKEALEHGPLKEIYGDAANPYRREP